MNTSLKSLIEPKDAVEIRNAAHAVQHFAETLAHTSPQARDLLSRTPLYVVVAFFLIIVILRFLAIEKSSTPLYITLIVFVMGCAIANDAVEQRESRANVHSINSEHVLVNTELEKISPLLDKLYAATWTTPSNTDAPTISGVVATVNGSRITLTPSQTIHDLNVINTLVPEINKKLKIIHAAYPTVDAPGKIMEKTSASQKTPATAVVSSTTFTCLHVDKPQSLIPGTTVQFSGSIQATDKTSTTFDNCRIHAVNG